MKKIEDYFVPWIKGIEMYISPHIEMAWEDKNLHRMMSNENPHQPSEKVLAAINKYGKMANRYSDAGSVVRTKIAELNGFAGPENVMLGNGTSEVYDMMWRSFLAPGDELIQHTPCFGIYKLRCNILGGKLVSVPMIYEEGQLLFDPDAIIKAVTPKTKLIVIANPNNPTGNFMAEKDFRRIADLGIPFVVDEAYKEYSGLEDSMVKLIKDYKNVLVTRTLSKAYGLAGLRFGYMLGNKEVVAQISATLIPWNVGTIPMWAALAALEDTEGLAMRIKFNNNQVAYIEKELSAIPGMTVFHTRGNYILFDAKGTGKKGDDIVAYVQEKGIILRPQNPMYDSDGFFRITVGTAEENRMAVESIKEYCAK